MDEFISEPLTPYVGTFDAGAMATGVPGLPGGFVWRGRSYAVVERLEAWKESAPEGGRPGGEVYLRRHGFRLRMSDGSAWSVYFTRQPPRGRTARGASARTRWFLLSRTPPELPMPERNT